MEHMTIDNLPVALRPVFDAVAQAVLAGKPVLLIGYPGAGATAIARRIPAALPPMTGDEIADVTWRYIAARLADASVTQRPFRAPHHTISWSAVLGGYSPGICGACRGQGPIDCRCKGKGVIKTASRLRPGEAHLAHGGVFFLDEAPEFRRDVLEAVFAPRSAYPCRYAIIGTAYPCLCGWRGNPDRECRCSSTAIDWYKARRVWDLFRVRIAIPPLSPDGVHSC